MQVIRVLDDKEEEFNHLLICKNIKRCEIEKNFNFSLFLIKLLLLLLLLLLYI